MALTLDTNALLKAAGIGAAIIFVIAVSANVFAMVAPELSVIGIACCCVAYLLYAVIGAGYAWFAQRNGTALLVGPMALGGGLSALIAGLVQGVINLIGSLIGLTTLPTATLPGTLLGSGAPSELTTAYGASFFAGLLIGICVVLFVSAALGAGGGAVYAAIAGNRPATSPPTLG